MTAAQPLLRPDSRPEPPRPAASRSPGRPHVTIRGLTKRFGEACIYENFDLELPRGVSDADRGG